MLGLVGRLILKLIVVGIWVVKRVIRRVLGVERIIVWIHLGKRIFKAKTKVYWRLNFFFLKMSFFLCLNQMKVVFIYRE